MDDRTYSTYCEVHRNFLSILEIRAIHAMRSTGSECVKSPDWTRMTSNAGPKCGAGEVIKAEKTAG
eukprot:scaffold656230_cov102-Prasinocladus_malaysianus.AAC.1